MSDIANKYMIYDDEVREQFISDITSYYGFDYVMGMFVDYDFTCRVGDYDSYSGIINGIKRPCFNVNDNTFNFNLVDMVERGYCCKDILVFSIVNNNNILILSNELNEDGEFFFKLNGNFELQYMKKAAVATICDVLRKYNRYDHIRVRACKIYSYETMVNSLIEIRKQQNIENGVDLSNLV